MMASTPTNAAVAAEGEPNLDKITEKIQHFHKFRHF